MQAEVALRSPSPAGRWPSAVVALRTGRKAARSGALWGYVFGAYVASSALGYAATYKTLAAREKFAAAFGKNAATDALIGPAHQIQTIAGFTAWRCLGVLSIVGAVWGLLIGTRLLRGEEEAGRWELLLAGQTTRRRAAGQALAGLGMGLAALFCLTAIITAVIGRSAKVHVSVGASIYFALALVASSAVFLAAGVLTSQLAATRRQASGYAGALLGACYALRMVADSGTGLLWMQWTTPLGWVEKLQPLTAPDPLPLLPLAGSVVVMSLLAVRLAGTRDLGSSTLPDRASAVPHTRLLFGPTGLTTRLIRPTIISWSVAIAASGLLVGFVAKAAGDTLNSSTSVEKVVSRLGGPGAGAKIYVGIVFLVTALVVALVAAGQLSVLRGEEAGGRLDHFLVRPVSRSSWLGGKLLLTTAALVLVGVIGGVSTWVGAATQSSGLSFATMLDAGLNLVPPAVCILGIGTLTFGVSPRSTSVTTYGAIAWSFLVEIVGGLIGANHWLLDTSVFHQMTPAPAVAPDWTSGGVMIGAGVLACVLGTVAFRHRDLAEE
ncbi:MAG: hypothetical protein ACLQK4_12120 [Acidimicrobiales bacterium]|jgi:ABC-2 type transport system permease protein